MATISCSFSVSNDFDKKSLKELKQWKINLKYGVKGGKMIMYFVVGLVSVGILGRDSKIVANK